ncbi:hypothetical protein BDN71DRAFT_547863 [Pleurotus eryngii]|uniref:Uncharacterized protein n=1 Tax=Pleurotus eryngii TaxID=5323 RepID=A0A9P5ZHS3_PLEER|nr:hypothetical protein BDN71DRAFT_547863 [Pleurotus eryngii]
MGFNYPTMSADIMIEHGFVYPCLVFARRVKRARRGYILWILMHALLPIIAARVSALSTGETAYPIPLYCRPLRPSSTGYSAIPLVSRSIYFYQPRDCGWTCCAGISFVRCTHWSVSGGK